MQSSKQFMLKILQSILDEYKLCMVLLEIIVLIKYISLTKTFFPSKKILMKDKYLSKTITMSYFNLTLI